MTTEDKVKEIKQSFRLRMNGVSSHSMREKGLDYHLNWGVSLPHLQEMAAEYEKDYTLAIALWKEDIRECNILATLLMPADQMPTEVAEIWMEQIRSQEMAEMCALHVFQYLDDAPLLAFRWIASERDLEQICGCHVLARLFSQGMEPDERGINEFLDQVSVMMSSASIPVKHAAMNCLNRFCELGDDYDLIARKALRNFDLF